MKILTFTTLYPNQLQTRHGIFVEQRLRHLLEERGIESKVVAPVPWFPIKSKRFGRYSKYATIPKKESRHGIDIFHPRYLQIPKIGMTIAPACLFVATLHLLRQIIKNGYDFDLIDAHYFYPDGVAAELLGKVLNKPVIITARGSDINLIPKFKMPRIFIIWAAQHANALITVSQDLKYRLTDLGVSEQKIRVFRNGVDLDIFQPQNKNKLREKYSLTRPTLLSVGNLVRLKGHHLVIQALASMPDYDLLIVGEGVQLNQLKKLSAKVGLGNRIRIMKTVSQQQLAEIYSAVDVLVLASNSEGWPNVLLESMACGTPVVATNVGAAPEIVATEAAGVIIENRSVVSITKGVATLMANYPIRSETRNYAERFSWKDTSENQNSLFNELICSSSDPI